MKMQKAIVRRQDSDTAKNDIDLVHAATEVKTRDRQRSGVAVITGAAAGIGRALAHEAAARGFDLLLADRNMDRLEELRLDLVSTKVRVLVQHVDVSQQSDLIDLADRAKKEFGEVAFLFNNAGVLGMGRSWEVPVEEWERVLRVNLWGVIHGYNAFIPMMLKQLCPSRVVNIASVAGLYSSPLAAPYSVSKHAVVCLSETLALDLQQVESRIKVHCVCPWFVRTQLADDNNAASHGDLEVIRNVISQVGMMPEQLARNVFDGIESDRFWIFTHEQGMEPFDLRVSSIKSCGSPMTLSLPDGARP